jgi:hypothetical protein
MRFDAALPSWYRAPLFDHLPTEGAQRRLMIPDRLEYPAQGEMPAGFEPSRRRARRAPRPVAPSPF